MGLRRRQRGSDPRRTYAAEQFRLGLHYQRLPSGDRGANIQRSIEYFTEALRFFTADAAPAEHAQTLNNLGFAYAELPAGDRSANLAKAIDCYTQALRLLTAKAAPAAYLTTQINLGNAYRAIPAGDRAANLAKAIDCFTEALQRATGKAAPVEYAKILNNLGLTYAELPTGDRAANLAKAIDCYTQALRLRTAKTAPAVYATTQYNLGTTYLELPTGDRAANLAKAINCYTQALRPLTAETAPAEYAKVLNNLGFAYAELPAGDRSANLAKAIDCHTHALRLTRDTAPDDHATAQFNLGNAYVKLRTGDRSANLARAIDCYTEALGFYTAENAPDNYAMTQIALGDAYHYQAFSTGDRAANVARAIDCFTEALRFCTAENAPAKYAMTQNHLGLAYAGLPTGDRAANLARAIDCFTEASRFYTADTAPAKYAMTQNNLGMAWGELFTVDRTVNLARAIDCYSEALRFFTIQTAPSQYAGTQNNLGTVYRMLPTGDRAANLARAIDCHTEALRFTTADAEPDWYAMTQNNLGLAYAELPTGDRAANLAKAIDCHTEALRFLTAEATPALHRAAAVNLGSIFFRQGRWAEAHTALSSAIRAGEFLYQATGTQTGRHAELGAAGNAVASDAYCLGRLGRLAEAVERLEAGRARALGEALARDRAALEEARAVDRAAFIAVAERIKNLEAEGRRAEDTEAFPAPGRQSFAQRSAELVQAREDLGGVIQRIRAYLPGFMGEGLDYPEIAAAASPGRPVVYLLTTSRGGLALLVPAGSQAPAPEHAVWLDAFTTGQLAELLERRDPSGQARGGYLAGQRSGDLDQLAADVAQTTEILRRQALGPLAERLAELGVAAATVIPVGLLSLLPLPAAAPDGCTIALAPSARALRAARHAWRERAEETPVLLAVGNPLPPPAGSSALEYAGLEVRAIERFFTAGSRRVLPEEGATRKAVAQCLPGATHVHLACHGEFNPSEPLDSALYLAGEDRLTLRGLLDGNLELSSQRLAVLSACQTGLTEFERVPDEVIGLPAGFLQAGIPGAVSTLWPVNDQSTAVLVAEFYRLLLAEQENPATALHRARGHLRDATARDLAEWFEQCYQDSGGTDQAAYEAATELRFRHGLMDRPYAEPVYWAGFVYTGP